MTTRAVAVVLALGSIAYADTPTERPTAIQIDREATPLTRPEFGFDGGAALPGGWGIALGLGWLEEPITFYTPGDATTHPVQRRETAFLAGSLALGESAIVDLRLPLSHQIGSRIRIPGGPSGERLLDRWVPGDLGIGVRLRVVHRPNWAVFARGDLTIPSGDSGDFAGEPSWTVAWALIARAQLPGHITVAASPGLRIRGDEVHIADRLVSNELTGAIGIAVGLPPIRPLWCVHEQVQLTGEIVGVLADKVANVKGPSPREWRVGLVTRPREDVTFSVRLGAGLASDEIGSPAFRALAVLTFAGASNVASLFPASEPGEEEQLDDDEVAAK